MKTTAALSAWCLFLLALPAVELLPRQEPAQV
jgi:hypothetical protein